MWRRSEIQLRLLHFQFVEVVLRSRDVTSADMCVVQSASDSLHYTQTHAWYQTHSQECIEVPKLSNLRHWPSHGSAPRLLERENVSIFSTRARPIIDFNAWSHTRRSLWIETFSLTRTRRLKKVHRFHVTTWSSKYFLLELPSNTFNKTPMNASRHIANITLPLVVKRLTVSWVSQFSASSRSFCPPPPPRLFQWKFDVPHRTR